MNEKEKTIDLAGIAQAEKEGKTLIFSSASEEHEIGILKIKEIIDKTTNMIFFSYKESLLSEPITYIISAVWGKKQGRLSISQEEINRRIAPVIRIIMEIFGFEKINEAQRFTIEYLIKGLIISKITYLIEAFKNRPKDEIRSVEEDTDLIDRLEPLGNA